MKIAVSGTHGLIGGAVTRYYRSQGHEVLRLVRRPAPDGIYWNPEEDAVQQEKLEGFDVIVHLAGENVAGGLWSAPLKERIRSSRVNGTKLLMQAIAGLKRPPRVVLTASAVGFYGDTGATAVDERSGPGSGFLADVCREWEAANNYLLNTSCRVVLTRFGMVLSRAGGALKKMLPVFRTGLGGRLGSGKQYVSWISLDDTMRALDFCVQQQVMRGPVNMVSPVPVTNAELSRALGAALQRPAVIPVPAPVIRFALGEMGESLLLSSSRVLPTRLTDAGFTFNDTEIGSTLEKLLKPRK